MSVARVPPASREPPQADPYASALALRAPSPLREFNEAGVLSAADVHVSQRLATLADIIPHPDVLLAAALAVRAPRMGHVFVDLASVEGTVIVESRDELDLSTLPWPAAQRWVACVAACGELVTVGSGADPAGGDVRPLRLAGSRLYLDRYWREERMVASDLMVLGTAPLRKVNLGALDEGIARLLGSGGGGGGDDDLGQRIAVACGVLRRLAVIAGGPGTGKTTTVARIVALLCELALAEGGQPPLVALAAPTGRAAARLQQAVHEQAGALAIEDAVRAALLALRASTIHRLLAYRPGSRTRFRHDRSNRLPHDVVIVDETSMVSLSLMARLLEAVRPGARLVLVGDHEQLTAIEAGAVLRDIVGPAAQSPRMSRATRTAVSRAVGYGVGTEVDATPIHGAGAFGDGIVVLERVHRYGPGIAAVARSIRAGDADAVLVALRDAGAEVTWIEPGGAGAAGGTGGGLLEPLREAAVTAGRAVTEAARAGDGAGALSALGSFRLLCAQRHGRHGVAVWTNAIEDWLAQTVPEFTPDGAQYAGRPLLITHNDHELRLYNGDTGVIVASGPGRLVAAFERDGELVELAPSRLEAVQTMHAMTIHTSQGSQFDVTAVVLGDSSSRILTRELLYTAVTRARQRLILVADEDAVRAAVQRPVARATALRERLWGSESG